MAREKLPNRRTSEIFRMSHDGTNYQVSYSRFPDGRLAEIFIAGSKVGTGINVMARDMALVTSLALQYGVPAREIRGALEQELDGTMRGPLGQLLKMIEEDGR